MKKKVTITKKKAKIGSRPSKRLVGLQNSAEEAEPKTFTQIQIETHYSGDNSKDFWMMVNCLNEPHRTTLYALGVALQNLEEQVLKNMHDVAPNFVARKYWFNK